MKLKIVCVDDQKDLQDGFEDNLENTGHDIIFFHNPETAFDFIEENHKIICFVFSDLKMPEMTGFELREKMLSNYREIPFVIFTGFYDKEMAKSAMNLSICEFLSKPRGFDELASTFEKFSKDRVQSIDDEFMMVNAFLEESTPMLLEIEELILNLEDEPFSRDRTLKTFFRLLHTIKGTASCVGLSVIADYAHKYEDFVTLLCKDEIPLNSMTTDVLLAGYDRVKHLYKIFAEGKNTEFDTQEEVKIFDASELLKSNTPQEGSGTTTPNGANSSSGKNSPGLVKDQKVSVFMSTLDDFMEMSGELTVIRNRIVKTVSNLEQRYQEDKELELLGEYLSEMHKVSSSLQSNITELRKSKLSAINRPLIRAVRDISKSNNKRVDFKFIDNDLRVDAVIFKALNSTLIHLVRNGLDHGLESIEERAAANKDQEGSLEVSFEETGEEVIVNIIDDGRGIDPIIIKKKALEKELYTAQELEDMSSQKLFQIIFESGFSTAKEVTEISGRGVGMDMVLSTIKGLGGRVLINSELGKGSHFKIVLPIPKSVLIVNSLMVKVADSTFAISLDEIRETLLINEKHIDDKIERLGESILLHHNDSLIPLIDIGNELSISKKKIDAPDYGSSSLNIILSRVDGYEFGLIVDQVIDFEEVVVKSLSKKLSHLNIYGGSTLHGDGDIAMFFDLEKVAEHFKFEEKIVEEEYDSVTEKLITDKDQVMIFELLSGTKYALPLEQVDRLEVLDVSKFEYTGSIVGVRYRDSFLPLIDLSDSMNGVPIISNNSEQTVNSIIVSHEERLFGVIINNIHEISTPLDQIDVSTSDGKLVNGTHYIDDTFVTMLNLGKIIKHSQARHSDEYISPVDRAASETNFEQNKEAA